MYWCTKLEFDPVCITFPFYSRCPHMRAVLTQHQKFHKAQQITQLASLASEVGMDEFEGWLAQMRLMRDEWARGGKVTLTTSTVHTRKHFSN